MMKTLIGLCFLGISFSSIAQSMTCLEKLLPFNRHSGQHILTNSEWYDGKETLEAESVRSALSFLTNSKLLCKPSEVVIKIQAVCTALMTDVPQSNTCFVFTNVGHFVINRDNARNTNFIFSKDKRYSEQTE